RMVKLSRTSRELMPTTVIPLRGATRTSPSKDSSSKASLTGVRLVANSSVMASRSTRDPAGSAPVRMRSRNSRAARSRTVPEISIDPVMPNSNISHLKSDISDARFHNMTTRRIDKMALVAFMQAGSTSVYAGSWRHPATEHGYLDASYYAKIGRQLEEGCFDLMFFDDRLAMPGIYGGSVSEAVRRGARPVKLDLGVVLGVLAQATSRIGLGATYSTTYYAPFHVARTFATLDHLSGGRAAWNVVTSVNDSEAQNFGVDAHLGHDERYDRADEFLDVVTGLWDTWEDDAILHDWAAGQYADPAKVHDLCHAGQYFSARGPLTVPRTPQGRPVIIQAGSSGRGREFASRWAELIFTGDPGLEVARSHYTDQKDRISDAGRDPATVRICPMAYAVVGESEAHAKEREALFLNDLVHPMASLTLLSELM